MKYNCVRLHCVIHRNSLLCVRLFGSIKETAVTGHTKMERYLVARHCLPHPDS